MSNSNHISDRPREGGRGGESPNKTKADLALLAWELSDDDLKQVFIQRFFALDNIINARFLERFITLMGDYRVVDTEIDLMLKPLEDKYYGY